MFTIVNPDRVDRNKLITTYYNPEKSIRENARDISAITGIDISKDRVARWLHSQSPAISPATSQSTSQYWTAERVINAINNLELGISDVQNQLMFRYIAAMNPQDIRVVRKGIVNPDNLDFFDSITRFAVSQNA